VRSALAGVRAEVRRLQRLHAAAAAPGGMDRLEAARQAWEDGTASVAQVMLAHPDSVEDLRVALVAGAPLWVAKERYIPRDGDHQPYENTPLWYPPDVVMPLSVADVIARHFWTAEQSLAEFALSCRPLRLTPAQIVTERQDSVLFAAAYGDRRALALRNRIWQIQADRWVLHPDLMEVESRPMMSARHADRHVEVVGEPYRVTNAVRDDLIPTQSRRDRPAEWALVSYTDLAEAYERLGWAPSTTNDCWSNLVSKGHCWLRN
jgi:hypothetical protein